MFTHGFLEKTWLRVSIRIIAIATLYLDAMIFLGLLLKHLFPWLQLGAVLRYGSVEVDSTTSSDAAGAVFVIAMWTGVLAVGVIVYTQKPKESRQILE